LLNAKVSLEELLIFKKSSGAKIAAAISPVDDDRSGFCLEEKWPLGESPLVLAIGSEAEGLSEELIAISDFKVLIKHDTKVESLNAAIAGSILMHHVYNQDRRVNK
jgi:tRNA G18 (ribose-2'-O)-methylase SpoU